LTQFSKELALTSTRGILGYRNSGSPVSRALPLEVNAFDRMAKPLASAGPEIIHLASKDMPTKSFFTKIDLLSSGLDDTIKNAVVKFSIFSVKNAKLSPFGYYIEHTPEDTLEDDFENLERAPIIISFFDWYSTDGFLRIDGDNKISRNLDIVFDPRYCVFDKSSVFDAEDFRRKLERSFKRCFLPGVLRVCAICALLFPAVSGYHSLCGK